MLFYTTQDCMIILFYRGNWKILILINNNSDVVISHIL